jgi:multimeric flavodoxin WrbA
MKVLGLVGSGRKDGNTNTLVSKILEGASASGHETQKVFLADFKVSPIGDCAVCRKAGHCLIEDDFDALLGEVLKSDCVIFGTPLYWFGPSAQMKAFIDRWVCKMAFDERRFRARLKGKRCLLAIPHQDEHLTGAEHLVGIMEKTFDYMEMAYLGKMQTCAWRRGDVAKDEAALKYAHELGTRLSELEDVKKATGSVTFSFGQGK